MNIAILKTFWSPALGEELQYVYMYSMRYSILRTVVRLYVWYSILLKNIITTGQTSNVWRMILSSMFPLSWKRQHISLTSQEVCDGQLIQVQGGLYWVEVEPNVSVQGLHGKGACPVYSVANWSLQSMLCVYQVSTPSVSLLAKWWS